MHVTAAMLRVEKCQARQAVVANGASLPDFSSRAGRAGHKKVGVTIQQLLGKRRIKEACRQDQRNSCSGMGGPCAAAPLSMRSRSAALMRLGLYF